MLLQGGPAPLASQCSHNLTANDWSVTRPCVDLRFHDRAVLESECALQRTEVPYYLVSKTRILQPNSMFSPALERCFILN